MTVLALVFTSVLSVARAQQSAGDNLYFNNGAGGSGTWEDGSGGTPWNDSNIGQSVDWNNSISTNAWFQGTPGTVTVSGTVDAAAMIFLGNDTVTGGTIQDLHNQGFLDVFNNSTVTVSSDLNFDTGYNNDQFDFDVEGTGSLTLGNILYTNVTNSSASTGHRIVIFNTDGASTTNLTGTYSTGTSGVTGGIWLSGSSAATLELSGDYTTSVGGNLATAFEGTLLINTSKLGTDNINAGAQFSDNLPYSAVLTNGAYTVNNQVGLQNIDGDNQTYGAVTVGGATADESTYTGRIQMIQTQAVLTAVAGGRVNFTGDVGGTSNAGIVKTGAGTVVLSNANDYNLGAYFGGPTGTTAADIQQGKLLVTNTSGSAFGNNSGVVNVEAGATLGGNGIVTQNVVAIGGTSIIAPGDPGYHSTAGDTVAASTGVLHLNGGLTAVNGLTMDFKLNGLANDSIDFGGSTYNLGDTVTINLSGTPTITAGNNGIFDIITGIDLLHSTPPASNTFTITAPAGFEVIDYGTGTGLGAGTGYVYVQLAATPEPSTYAMMLGGMALLGFFVRRRLA